MPGSLGHFFRLGERTLRVGGWLHFLGLFLLGLLWAAHWKFFSDARGLALGTTGLLACALFLGFTYGINNYYDKELDSPQKNPFARPDFPAGPVLLLLFVMAAAAVFIVFVFLSQTCGWCFAAMAAASWLYSGPARLKRIFVLGTFMNLLIFMPLFFAGVSVVRSLGWADVAMCGLLAFSVLNPQLAQELQDKDDDSSFGIRTLPVVLGAGRTLFLLAAGSGLRAVLVVVCARRMFIENSQVAVFVFASVLEIILVLTSRAGNYKRLRLGLRYVNIVLGFSLVALWWR